MYQIVSNVNKAILIRAVIAEMENGWTPQGGISVTTINNRVDSHNYNGGLHTLRPDKWEYSQAMIKIKTKNPTSIKLK